MKWHGFLLKKCPFENVGRFQKNKSSQQAALNGNPSLLSCVRASERRKIWLARAATPNYTVRNERSDSRHGSSSGRLRWTGPAAAATNPGPAVLGHLLWRFSDVFLGPLEIISWQFLYQPWGFWRHGRHAGL